MCNRPVKAILFDAIITNVGEIRLGKLASFRSSRIFLGGIILHAVAQFGEIFEWSRSLSKICLNSANATIVSPSFRFHIEPTAQQPTFGFSINNIRQSRQTGIATIFYKKFHSP
jgi:hypothetical protein